MRLPESGTVRGFIFLLWCLCLSSFAFTGCQEVAVAGRIILPAEINMAGYQRVTIAPIQGSGGALLGAHLREALVQKHFEVLDRDITTRQKEIELEQLGLATPSAGREGKILSAEVGIRCTIVRHNFSQEVVPRQFRQNNGYIYTLYSTRGQATIEVSFDVTDLSNNKFITTKSILANPGFQSDYSASPLNIDPEPLFAQGYDQVVQKFMQAIAPFYVNLTGVLYKIKDVPANDVGIGMFQSQNYTEAVKEFEQALAFAKTQPEIKPQDLARIAYNTGLTHEFAGDFEKAISSYEDAIRFQNDELYAKVIARCRWRIEQDRKLREQQGISARGSIVGVGIQLGQENGQLKVIRPMEGSPAYKAGIEAGDFITAIDGKTTVNMSVDDAIRMITGNSGTTVILRIKRVSLAADKDYTLTREVINDQWKGSAVQ